MAVGKGSFFEADPEREEGPDLGDGVLPLSEVPDLSEIEDEDERIEAIQTWFLENFEDPANETPYEGREGGYQYVWGGPFDLWEEMSDAFGDQATEEEINAAAEGLSGRGHEWAPAGHRVQAPDEDYREPVPPLSERLEALGGQLDTIEKGVDDLLQLDIEAEQPVHGIGHNLAPPDAAVPDNWFDAEDPPLTRGDLLEIKNSIAELRLELAKPNPATDASLEVVTRAETWFTRFRKFVLKLGTGAAVGIAGAFGKHVGDAFLAANPGLVDAAVHAANTLSHWMMSLF